MLEALFNSSKILGLASGKLKDLFKEQGLSAIVIVPDPAKTDGPLPGFRLDMYASGIVVLAQSDYDRLHAEMEAKPHMLTTEEYKEYQYLKNWQASLKTDTENGEFQTSDTDQPAQGEPLRINRSGIDPAY